MKKRILFVDDEPNILAGLRGLLRRQRKEWEMEFAPGGEEAIAILSEREFDVIVSDMRMPRVDGAKLLAHVKQKYPQMVRIILSGYSELEVALQVVPIAHQFLSKPCDADTLRGVVSRACGLQSLLSDATVRSLVGQMGALPAVPETYQALRVLLSDPDSSLLQVSDLVERDVGVAVKVLQLVNSAFFGQARRMTSVSKAVSLLGTNMIKHLVLGIETFATLPGKSKILGFDPKQEQDRAIAVGQLAKRMLASDRSVSEDAMLAGMLHEVGTLIMAAEMPEKLQESRMLAVAKCCTIDEAEREVFGVSHAEVGAYLLGLWGLPYSVVEAVANHHSIERVADLSMGPLVAVHVASGLLQEYGQSANSDIRKDCVNREYLAACGLDGEYNHWAAMAAEMLGADQEVA